MVANEYLCVMLHFMPRGDERVDKLLAHPKTQSLDMVEISDFPRFTFLVMTQNMSGRGWRFDSIDSLRTLISFILIEFESVFLYDLRRFLTLQ
jgi:hypothetical protein